MHALGRRKPWLRASVEPRPGEAVPLASTTAPLTPVTPPAGVKHREQAAVAGHAIGPLVPPQPTAQPGALLGEGFVQAPPPGGLDLRQCLAPPRGKRLAPHRHLPLARLTAAGRHAATSDGLRWPLTTPLPPVGGTAAERAQPRLLRGPRQLARLDPCPQCCPEPFGGAPGRAPRAAVVAVAYEAPLASGVPPPPSRGPASQDGVERAGRRHRAHTPPWGRPCRRRPPGPRLPHARLPPRPAMAHHAPVPKPGRDARHQPAVVARLTEPTHVGSAYPVDRALCDAPRHRLQRRMRPASRANAVGEAPPVPRVDGGQHRHRRPLGELIVPRREADGPLAARRLGDVAPRPGARVVRAPLEPVRPVPPVRRQLVSLGGPCLAIAPQGRVPGETVGRFPPPVAGIDLVPQRRQPPRPVLPRRCTSPLARRGQGPPARRPAPGLRHRLPLGQLPSRHHRRRFGLGLISVHGPGVPLFGRFAGTTERSDSLRPSVTVVPWRFTVRAVRRETRPDAGPPESRTRGVRACLGASTPPGACTPGHSGVPAVAFRVCGARRPPGSARFRGALPGRHVPLATLHGPRDRAARLTRRQCGGLVLHCRRLPRLPLVPVCLGTPER
jgi:hypothetical protein